jgi:hypothetical protein
MTYMSISKALARRNNGVSKKNAATMESVTWRVSSATI